MALLSDVVKGVKGSLYMQTRDMASGKEDEPAAVEWDDSEDFFSTDGPPNYYDMIVAVTRRANDPNYPRYAVRREIEPLFKAHKVDFDEREFERQYKQFAAAKFGREYEKGKDAASNILDEYFSGGRYMKSGMKSEDVDSKQLEMGIEIEKEHTEDPDIAARIALDHLAEIPDYYTRLKRMEEEAKGETDA